MAVTKIHRTSRMALLIAVIISLIVMGVFYLGGQVPEAQKIVAGQSQPTFTDILLYWCYIILAITIIALFIFAIIGFFTSLKENPKKALGGLVALVGIAVLLVIMYVIGDGTLLNIPGYDGGDNTPTTLKITDMWIYSMYAMLALTFLAIILMPIFKRRK